MVVTGSISNDDLMAAVAANLSEIVAALAEVQFVELRASSLVVHENRPEP